MLRFIVSLLLIFRACFALAADADDGAGAGREDLHFFWSKTCSHCEAARPFVEALPARLPWLAMHSYEVSADAANRERYRAMAAELGEEARIVPAFIFCGRMEVGFDDAETTGRALEAALVRCHGGSPAADEEAVLTLPLLGRIDPAHGSLPVFTLVIAGLDAFNPCAFFVLLFLLSLLVHAGSRARMLYVGGVFVFFSGFVYFLFMAAWLNVFRWLGELSFVTAAAGALALVVAILNIKDYFLFKQGPSLSIPESAKPGLFQRMRGLLKADSLAALTVGTVVLAVAANSYELLCTAGFPMVYTRLLTLADLPPGAHYAYLAAYNVVYVLPLLAITLAFTFTLGSRKLSEAEGRFLKLLSGLMMLGLGVLLLAAPQALNDLRVALALLVGAVGGAWIVDRAGRR